MKAWWLPLLLGLLVAICHFRQDSLRRILLGLENEISEKEFREEVAQLQFRGLTADAAEVRLRAAINIRRERQGAMTFDRDVRKALESEMQAWRRQWEKPMERDKRLMGQGMTEIEMEDRVREALLDQAWLEARMAPSSLVTAEELQAAYQAQSTALILPQMQRIEHLFLAQSGREARDRSAEIRKLHQRLSGGEDWATLVQTHSEDARTKRKQGDLSWLGISRTPQAVLLTAQALQTGKMSSPIQSELGWHIIRLIKRQDERLPRLDELRTELLSVLQADKRQAALEWILEMPLPKPASD